MERIESADKNDISLIQCFIRLPFFQKLIIDQGFVIAGSFGNGNLLFIAALHFDIVNVALVVLDIHIQPDSPGKKSDIDGFFDAGIGDFLYPDSKDLFNQHPAEPFVPHDPFK